jgi:tRNA A-37 threonylcarbamoyl transferase component Bud32
MSELVLAEGLEVAGRYRLERRLGKGGMGEVWRATQLLTKKSVALKFLADDKRDDPDVRRRFLREARAASAVSHPNVVQIHDVLELAEHGGVPVIVMEHLRGEPLEARMARGPMDVGELSAVLLRVVSAVGTAHAAGVVHRDLKPDNIFLAETPEGVEVKVLDFGIAKLTTQEGSAAETGGLTHTGTMLGTPYYMSPEQAFGEKKIDHRADVWSLGIILYRGLTGVLPTQADNLGQILKIIMTNAIRPVRELRPDVPDDLADLVGRMLEPSLAGRLSSLHEARVVLERHAGVVADGFGEPAPPSVTTAGSGQAMAASAGAKLGPPRSSLLVALGALLALGGLVALVVSFTRRPEASLAGDASLASAAGAPSQVITSAATTGPPSAAASGDVAPAVASASASSTSSALGTSSARASAAPRPSTGGRPSAAATSASTAAPSAAPTSIGGVVETAPF